jgi:predicted GIY-YIG superfamily endonuclease
MDKSYVYIIGDKTHRIYKIGKANDIDERLRQLKSGNPYLEIFEKFPFDNSRLALDAERYLQFIYRKKLIAREWFNLNEWDIIEIKKRATSGVPFPITRKEKYNCEVIIENGKRILYFRD